jgi:hypothetical protein
LFTNEEEDSQFDGLDELSSLMEAESEIAQIMSHSKGYDTKTSSRPSRFSENAYVHHQQTTASSEYGYKINFSKNSSVIKYPVP